jgi:hypothetical protein
MSKRIGGAILALAIVFGISAAASITAQAQYGNDRYGRYGGYGNNELNQGYQYGVNTGASDAQRGQNYNPERSRYYRNASSQAFREGFVRGYDEGYRQYSGHGNGRYGNGRYGNGRYGNGNQYELNQGYQYGVNTGASDAQHGQSYNPERSRYYRNASSQAFREGFVRGYDEGYRQYSNNRRYRRNNTGSIWDLILGRR